ncbi:tyrosine-type recombinase/integrase, partial [Candidatus Sumerlaeota bacterium]
ITTTKRAAKGRRAKPRYIPMNQAVREMLETMPRDGERVFDPDANLRWQFSRACKFAGIGHCRVHDLRHTFASHLAMAGVPLLTIKELLGHTTLEMTLRYSHLSPQVAAEAVAGLNFGAQSVGARVLTVMGESG